jgi:hypothetical protein
MPLSLEDQGWVKMMAKEVSREIIVEVLQSHVQTCPVAQKIAVSKAMLMGLILGALGLGSSLGALVEKFL